MTDPRLIHLADQLGAALRVLPPLFWDYYRILVAEGFSETQALEFVLDIQRIVLEGSLDTTGSTDVV